MRNLDKLTRAMIASGRVHEKTVISVVRIKGGDYLLQKTDTSGTFSDGVMRGWLYSGENPCAIRWTWKPDSWPNWLS